MLSAAALVVVSSMLVGQAASQPSNYEHLKIYEALVGTWVYDGPLLEDLPVLDLKKGTPFRIESTISWGSDKNVINTNNSWQFGGRSRITAHIVTFWDAKSKTIVARGVNNIGGYGEHSTTYDPATRTWTTKDVVIDAAGETTTAVVVMSLVDPDTLTWQVRERTGPGLTPESPKYTGKRLKPMGGMPADVRQKLSRVAGYTVSEVEWGDKTMKIETDGDWTPQGYSLVRQFTIAGGADPVYGTSVISWDVASKCLLSFNVYSNGDHDTTRWTDVDGDTWTGKGTGLFFGTPWESATKLTWRDGGVTYEDTTDGKPFISVTKFNR